MGYAVRCGTEMGYTANRRTLPVRPQRSAPLSATHTPVISYAHTRYSLCTLSLSPVYLPALSYASKLSPTHASAICYGAS
eukprot:3177319-Rhodomonas_salina.2